MLPLPMRAPVHASWRIPALLRHDASRCGQADWSRSHACDLLAPKCEPLPPTIEADAPAPRVARFLVTLGFEERTPSAPGSAPVVSATLGARPRVRIQVKRAFFQPCRAAGGCSRYWNA